jgi:uncharacterized RDD family membrane protein YckC
MEQAAIHATQDQAVVATYAGFWRRVAASAIDWTIFVIASSPFGILLGRLPPVAEPWQVLMWVPIALTAAIGYLTYFLLRGQSLGMRTVGIRIIDEATGAAPTSTRALVKSLFAVVFYASVLTFALSLPQDPDNPGYSAAHIALILSSLALAVGGLLLRLWMIWDEKKQTLVDKLVGVVFLTTRARLSAPFRPAKTRWY